MTTPKKNKAANTKKEKSPPDSSLNERLQDGDGISASIKTPADSDASEKVNKTAEGERSSAEKVSLKAGETDGQVGPDSPGSATAEERTVEGSPVGFPVVGIGASAGGLEAMTDLLQNLPAHPETAMIFIQHLDPRYRSSLVEILGRTSQISVREAEDGMKVEKGCLYVIPADRDLAMMNGKLQLMNRPEGPARHLPIDHFFRSLAEDQAGNAIGVILSGTGSDGALGLRAINAGGGITLVQEPSESKYNGMPAASIATGHVDMVLPTKQIAAELARIARQPHANRLVVDRRETPPTAAQQDLDKVFMMVRRVAGVDFSQYKRSSVERRLSRRMLLHRIESLKIYVKYLQQNPSEISALFEDLLINVTSFFREPTAFQMLRETVFPRILVDQPHDAPIRIWVPACSTGEEAYSIALSLLEHLGEDEPRRSIQIFATDVSPTSIEKARLGKYTENIAGEVSAERLQKYFVKIDNGYQVRKSVRDLCVFAIQNLAKDPPFSRLDLISCRNVLIYMDAVLQKRIIPVFHYALRPNGFLLLGASETVGDFNELFTMMDRKNKIYLRKPGVVRVPIEFSPIDAEVAEAATKADTALPRMTDIDKELHRIISHRFGPNGVLINDQLDIERFFGQTGRFFEPSPGTASLNLLKIIRPGIGVDLRTLIQEAKTTRKGVRKEGLRMRFDGSVLNVNLEVLPVGVSHFLLSFEEVVPAPPKEKSRSVKQSSESLEELEGLRMELAATKESLQAIIEEHEATNEELRAANEEIQSSNEELQSTNEELTTAKEELQSTNEELTTLNEEQENRNVELREALNDLSNLLNSVSIPLLILDNDLRIRRFAPSQGDSIFKLIAGDCGRPLNEMRLGFLNFDMDKLERDVREVIRTLNVYEAQVQTQDGHWYSMRIRPYRTSDDRINGAVVALFDVTALRKVESYLRAEKKFTESVMAAIHEPVLVMDRHSRVISANAAFYEMFQVTPRLTEGYSLFEADNRRWDVPAMREFLAQITETGPRNYLLENHFPGVGNKKLSLNAMRIEQSDEKGPLIFVAFKEVAEK